MSRRLRSMFAGGEEKKGIPAFAGMTRFLFRTIIDFRVFFI